VTAPAQPSRSFDLGAKLREDWEVVKREARTCVRELEGAWHKVRLLFD
jgi:hypothetical protein